jgi:C4-dicarboxylate-specific signal transduction histidine kinase
MATQEVIALSQQEMRRNRVMVTTAFAENAPTVPGDRVQLQQVILNLLLNAMDAMRSVEGRTRRVAIRTQFDDEAITLSVSDNGHALAPDDLARVFDAFYTTKEEGMGIGLSVSRSIIERHHGKLWAAVNDDAGMTFAFSLPRHTPA